MIKAINNAQSHEVEEKLILLILNNACSKNTLLKRLTIGNIMKLNWNLLARKIAAIVESD